MKGGIHALASFGLNITSAAVVEFWWAGAAYAVGMACITANENALVMTISIYNTLPYRVDGVPVDSVPANGVRFENTFCLVLDFFDTCSLFRTPVFVCR